MIVLILLIIRIWCKYYLKKAFALILTNPIFAVQNKMMFWK